MTKRVATVSIFETDMDDYYSVTFIDENGRRVSQQVTDDEQEARQLKESWENGQYGYLTES